jgi:hypothetical protein
VRRSLEGLRPGRCRRSADGKITRLAEPAAAQGAKVELESRAEFAAFVDREVARWPPIVKATEIDMD